ncbi:MAG TPA: LysR family transcriptional regulator [Alphaproteobacteria bacterium]|nr:LysR family transcriptional regulator [Alphaproteobacteria bacterium]
MNLAELTTFLAVAELKSLVRAAERLNVTQSTVTSRMDSLETKLGQKLLHRHKSGTELTSAGFKFVRYAEVVTQLWRQAKYEVGLPRGFTSVCNVGCYFDLWERLCDRFMDHMHKVRPDVAVAVWPGDQHNIDRWLDSGLIDLALCYSPHARGKFAVREIMVDEFVQVEFDRPKSVGSETAYVFVDYGEQFRRDHAVAFARTAPAAVTLASSRWAIDYLSRWGGTGYLPRRHARHFERIRRARVLKDSPVLRQTVFLVENMDVTRQWPWFEEAIGGIIAEGEGG